MSKTYYRPAWPVTSVRATPQGRHVRLDIWIAHGLSGSLTLDADNYAEFVALLRGNEVATTWCGGAEQGRRITWRVAAPEKHWTLIAETGEIATVGELAGSAPRLGEDT